MKFYIFLLVILRLNYGYCLECINFNLKCMNKPESPQCFKCKNVQTSIRKQWENQLNLLIDIHNKMGKKWWSSYYANVTKNGVHCCKAEGSYPKCFKLLSGRSIHIPYYVMGCIKPSNEHEQMCHNDKLSNRCCSTHYCNAPRKTDLDYILKEAIVMEPLLAKLLKKQQINYTYILIISVFFICLLICFTLMIKFLKWKGIKLNIPTIRKKLARNKALSMISKNSNSSESKRFKTFQQTERLSSNSDNLLEFSCSGSGAGAPMMTPKTAASDISLVCYVGEGRFGCVWQGYWNGDSVAVKIFSSRDERAWSREKTVYQQNYLRHGNILGFITADSRDNGISTELWLVTEFHERGSLFDYLKSHTISVEDLVKMTRSITNGIAYLHMEINGIECKPAIAHRDLKSRNILVKSCGECCIGDLGLAVRLNSRCHEIQNLDRINNNGNGNIAEVGRIGIEEYRVGTRRYMAPEILDGSLEPLILATINENSNVPINGSNTAAIESLGEAFKRADIYSYSLVMWEIFRRVKCPLLGINAFAHEVPYQSDVNGDPSIEDMYNVVCKQGLRPPISPQWTNTAGSSNSMVEIRAEVVRTICQAMRESWFANPASRLSIMRLKKIMGLAASQLQMQQKQQQQELHQHLSQQEQQQFQQESGNSIDSLNNILEDSITTKQFSSNTAFLSRTTRSLNNSSQHYRVLPDSSNFNSHSNSNKSRENSLTSNGSVSRTVSITANESDQIVPNITIPLPPLQLDSVSDVNNIDISNS